MKVQHNLVKCIVQPVFPDYLSVLMTMLKQIKYIFKLYPTILCDDRDPPWISNKIKNLINEKNIAYQSYIQNGKNKQSF